MNGRGTRPAPALPPALPAAVVRLAFSIGALSNGCIVPVVSVAADPTRATTEERWSDGNGDLARKADIMHGPRWQRAMIELTDWLATQTIYHPEEVRRIKIRFSERVEAMSSRELEYLLDSISAKIDLLNTAEARDAKAWLGEYLSAMSDARRASELRGIPDVLEMTAAQLSEEIRRIDRKRTALRQRQQGVEMRRDVMVERAAANREATTVVSQAAAARARTAPSHSPYRQGGGSPPFSDVEPRRLSIAVGPFGAYIGF
jgi:hypothetical protein